MSIDGLAAWGVVLFALVFGVAAGYTIAMMQVGIILVRDGYKMENGHVWMIVEEEADDTGAD